MRCASFRRQCAFLVGEQQVEGGHGCGGWPCRALQFEFVGIKIRRVEFGKRARLLSQFQADPASVICLRSRLQSVL